MNLLSFFFLHFYISVEQHRKKYPFFIFLQEIQFHHQTYDYNAPITDL